MRPNATTYVGVTTQAVTITCPHCGGTHESLALMVTEDDRPKAIAVVGHPTLSGEEIRQLLLDTNRLGPELVEN